MNERFLGYLKYGSLLDYWLKKKTTASVGVLAGISILLVGTIVALICCCRRRSRSKHGVHFFTSITNCRNEQDLLSPLDLKGTTRGPNG